MKTYRSLIIDDERLARITLTDMLSRYPSIRIVGESGSVAESIRQIIKLEPDLLFLDVELSDGTGFDLINRINYPGKIIFTTAYDEYAIRAFEVNALHYLMKPISHKQLSEALTRLEASVAEKEPGREVLYYELNDRLLASCGSCLNFISISSIAAIKAAGIYTVMRTFDGSEYIDPKTMSEWEARLPGNHFMRINRSVIINFDAIEKTEQRSVNLVLIHVKGIAEPFRISRIYYKKIRNKFS